MRAPIRRAAKDFKDFTGERATKVTRARLADQDVTGWKMGPVLGVAYQARRDGVTERYFHEFAKSARPDLVAGNDGRQLYIAGGRYRVTDRGIEDMPNLFVVNPSPRKGRKQEGFTMANRRARRASASRRRRRSTSIFVTNPRRRRRVARRRSTIFRANPRRRRRYRRNAATAAPRRIYRRNPRRRAAARSRRRYRRNPIGGPVGKLTSLLMPAVFIGLGGVASEIAAVYLPLPLAWRSGPMRLVVKGAVGVGIGLVIAKVFKQKRLGYYFAAGAVALMTHDIAKAWLNANAPAVRLGQYGPALRSQFGFTNPASVARFGAVGQYSRALPMNRFGGANTIASARQPGGEMNFAA